MNHKTYNQPSIPRWHYRFNNYKRAFFLLQESIELSQIRELSELECEGIIQRFEYTMELAWKVMKDYLENQSVVIEQVTPRAIIRKAFEANIIRDGEVWQNALDARNEMSHTYSFNNFKKVIKDIEISYLLVLNDWYDFLIIQYLEESKYL